jgi:GT2 family glycosyltransferase
MFNKALKFLSRLPRYVAVAGGWMPWAKLASLEIRREGFGSKLKRAFDRNSRARDENLSQDSVEVERFTAAECKEIVRSLDFQCLVSPQVSIVIPVFNQFAYTIECLAAIGRHPQQTAFELIIIDDASTDESASVLSGIPGVKFLRNEANIGYLHSCNRAAQHARGKYICFLNNDTQVQKQWLDPLVRQLEQRSEVGIVGSKLLFPDGRLQEAGARLVKPADSAQGKLVGELIGMDSKSSNPRYIYSREVEYCSGACFLIRHELFLAVGGFDPSYAPAYFEDVDLAYKVRKAGYRVRYEPLSEVVHHLSVSVQDRPEFKRQQVARNADLFLSKWGAEVAHNRRIRLLAFYLPQYHPTPENDEWWGKGFTEWTNVAKARPNFEGHNQPHLPTELGFYDLRLSEVRQQQAALAEQHGIHGFCYYYYWFNGKRLLNRPLDEVRASGEPNFPFCICWANENWTRTWDGQEHQILMAQHHSTEDDIAFIQGLFPIIKDSRYICVDGKPLILVYKTTLLPEPAETARRWRDECRKAGIGEIYLACVHNNANPKLNSDPGDIGFDAAVEFPPAGKSVSTDHPPRLKESNFRGFFYDYVATMKNMLSNQGQGYMFFRGVMPGWDNTARRQDSAHIFLGSSPEKYQHWLESALEWTARMRVGDERIVFINAWNEWAEGNHLEPDRKHGRGFLEATRAAITPYT